MLGIGFAFLVSFSSSISLGQNSDPEIFDPPSAILQGIWIQGYSKGEFQDRLSTNTFHHLWAQQKVKNLHSGLQIAYQYQDLRNPTLKRGIFYWNRVSGGAHVGSGEFSSDLRKTSGAKTNATKNGIPVLAFSFQMDNEFYGKWTAGEQIFAFSGFAFRSDNGFDIHFDKEAVEAQTLSKYSSDSEFEAFPVGMGLKGKSVLLLFFPTASAGSTFDMNFDSTMKTKPLIQPFYGVGAGVRVFVDGEHPLQFGLQYENRNGLDSEYDVSGHKVRGLVNLRVSKVVVLHAYMNWDESLIQAQIEEQDSVQELKVNRYSVGMGVLVDLTSAP